MAVALTGEWQCRRRADSSLCCVADRQTGLGGGRECGAGRKQIPERPPQHEGVRKCSSPSGGIQKEELLGREWK